MASFVARRIRQLFPRDQLEEFLGPDVILVPAPSSALLRANSLWATREFAEALVGEGLGRAVAPELARVEAVPKSAFADPGQRPTAQRHYDTIRCGGGGLHQGRFCVVDDVISRGSTLLGAASRLQEVFPNAEVRGFVAARTHPFTADVRRLDQPCTGRVHLHWTQSHRKDEWHGHALWL